MSNNDQWFEIRCGNCMKKQSWSDAAYNGINRGSIVKIGETKSGLGIKCECLECGKLSTRYSKAARKL